MERDRRKELPSEEQNMLNQPKMFIIIRKMKTAMMMMTAREGGR